MHSVSTISTALSASTAALSEDLLQNLRKKIIQTSSFAESVVFLLSDELDLPKLFSNLVFTASTASLSDNHRALAVDTISAWLVRGRDLSNGLASPLTITALDKLCDVFLAFFDDAPPGLTKALKDLLSNVLVAAAAWPEQTVLQRLALRGIWGVERGEGKKGGYYAVEVALRKGVSADWLMTTYTGVSLLSDMLEGLIDRNLAPVIGKTVVALLASRRREMGDDDAQWARVWTESVRMALQNEGLRPRTVTYVLPGLLKLSVKSFEKFIRSLGLDENGSISVDADLGVLLCCLVVGKELGFVGDSGDEYKGKTSNMPIIILPADFVAPLLGHARPHIRVSALNLAIKSAAITRPIHLETLAILKNGLLSLHAEPDAEVRDSVIGSIRNLVERLASSSYSSGKELRNLQKKFQNGVPPSPNDIKKMIQLDTLIGNVRDFCLWYIGFLENLLLPGSNYQRFITGLRALTFLVKSGLDASLSGHAFMVLPGNGSIASNGEPFKKGLFKWPEFSKELRIFQPKTMKILQQAMFNPFDDIRALSADVLQLNPEWNKTVIVGFLERGIGVMNEGGRESDADGVARTLVLIFEIVRRGDIVFDERDKMWGFGVNNHGNPALGILGWILDVVEKEYLGVATVDIQRAIRKRPVHGFFSALRLILEMKNTYCNPFGSDLILWRGLHERIFTVCEGNWRITRAPLCFDSPEGHMPVDIIEDCDEDMNTQTVMSYSWRAVKESAALMGIILSKAPDSTLDSTYFERGGKLLLQQLADIRHRGAFSAVSPSFMALCVRCFRSNKPELQELPRLWLRQNLELILSKSSTITRRSAGLPYLIIGVLASEVDNSRPLLASTFFRFIEIAMLPIASSKEGEKLDLPQVHALNCMKHLFTDARVSQAVVPFIGTGLELAVSCFGSEIWAIRNCGVMLFTALTNRLFGLRKSRNDYKDTATTFTTKSFFEKYPRVREVLLANLIEKVGALDGEQGKLVGVSVEMVYPALSLIARMDVEPEYEEMEEFRQLIETCLRSRIWKVRVMAARAYATLIGHNELVFTLENLMGVGLRNQNILHGHLCAARTLLERRFQQAASLDDTVRGKVFEIFADVFEDFVVINKCSITKAVFLQVATEYLLSHDLPENLRIKFASYCSISTANLREELSASSFVGRFLLKEHLVSFLLSNDLVHYTRLISSTDDEIHLNTITYILALPASTLPPSTPSFVSTVFQTAVFHHNHLHRAAALRLLLRLQVSLPTEFFEKIIVLATAGSTAPIREAAIALLGRITPPSGIAAALSVIQIAAAEDQELDIRFSALRSLPLLLLSSRCAADKAKALFVLFDLINDDDDKLRMFAAESVAPVSPLVAAVKVANEVPRVIEVWPELVRRILGSEVPDGNLDTDTSARARHRALFETEKKNMWVNEREGIRIWGCVAEDVLISCSDVEAKLEVFKRWKQMYQNDVVGNEYETEIYGENMGLLVERRIAVDKILNSVDQHNRASKLTD